MAENLLKAGHVVYGHDIVAQACKAFAACGGKVIDDLDAVLGEAEVVVSMLPAGEHVKALYTGGLFKKVKQGCSIIDCSTIEVSVAREVAALAAKQGLSLLDAPVSGGVGGATAGSLTFMVGGDEAAFKALEPLFKAMGKNIILAGPSGAGQAAKMCNNLMLGIQMLAVCEGFNLADAVGLDRAKLFAVASTASGQCWSLTNYCPIPGPVPTAPSNRDYAAGFTAALMLKDMKLGDVAADETQTAIPLARMALAQYAKFCESGGAEKDFSGVITMLRNAHS